MKKQLNNIRYHLNDWFEMSKSERNGVTVLAVFILLMIAYNYSAPYFFGSKNADNTHLSAEIESWLANVKYEESDLQNIRLAMTEKTEYNNRQLFKFNPNTASIEELIKLGFTERQAQSVKNYLAKGGKFKIKSDFSKMYFLKEEFYRELYPYIDLPENIGYAKKENDFKSKNPNVFSDKEKTNYNRFDYSILKVELNSADTTELKKIKGIGSFTAQNIIRFREHLGGFTSIDQLAEVYPLNAEKVDSMRPHLLVDLGLMQKININEVTAEQLSKHPYLNSSQAKSIIAYRTMHGNFREVEGIKKSVLIDQKTFEKVKDYLRVN